MKGKRSADLQRCVLAAILLTCLYFGNAAVLLNSAFSPALLILIVLGIAALAVAIGLWQLQGWVWHGAQLVSMLGIVLGAVALYMRFRGGQLDLPSATLILLVSALLVVFLRRRDVRRALGR